jgi:hypothetical protein
MPRPTGIPTHIQIGVKLDAIAKQNLDYLDGLKAQTELLRDTVKEAIRENDYQSGNITMPVLEQKLDEVHASIVNLIKESGLLNRNVNNSNNEPTIIENMVDCHLPTNENTVDYCHLPPAPGLNFTAEGLATYYYLDQYWDVPRNWKYGKLPLLIDGWKHWLTGMASNITLVNTRRHKAPIRPFRRFNVGRLPEDAKKQYWSSWRPIFKKMEECPVLAIPENITADFINYSFEKAMEYLKTKVSYVFKNKKNDYQNWTISTWSKMVSPAYVLQFGTEEDIINLPPGNYRRGKCGRKRKHPAEGNHALVPIVVAVHNNNETLVPAVPIVVRQSTTSVRRFFSPVQQQTRREEVIVPVHQPARREEIIRNNNESPFAKAFDDVPAEFLGRAFEEPVLTADERKEEAETIRNYRLNQLNENSNDPTLLVRIRNEERDSGVQNASRRTARTFNQAVTTILDAASIDDTKNYEKTSPK